MNRVRRLAEDLVNRYPTLFSGDFEKNKQALTEIAVIHTRSLRNQLAGAITKIVKSNSPGTVESQEQVAEESAPTGNSEVIPDEPIETARDSNQAASLSVAQESSKDNTIAV